MFKCTKKILAVVIGAALLVAIVMDASAAFQPKYLSIKNYDRCLATKNMGTWRAWCLPQAKPEACATRSWQQLNNLTGKDKLPGC